jgi:hypothetical protein
VWDSQGCGNVINAVARLAGGGRAAVFVVLDSDAKARRVSGGDSLHTADKMLEEILGKEEYQPRIAWLGKKELEDEWKLEDLAVVAEQNWPREDGRRWEAHDFSEVVTAEKPSDMITYVIRHGARTNLVDRPNPTKEHIAKLVAKLPGAYHPQPLVELLKAVGQSCRDA